MARFDSDEHRVDDDVVRHTCDHKPCVNPRHLLVGSRADKKMRERNRYARVGRKLDPHRVREIRELHESGITQKELAEMYSVNVHAIQSRIVRRTWKNVT